MRPNRLQMAAAPVVQKSPNDARAYKALVLPNGLRVLLIHDPEICNVPAAVRSPHPGEEEVVMGEDVESLLSGESDDEDMADSEEVRGERAHCGAALGSWQVPS